MTHECKRILNKQVVGEGLWHADLAKAQDHQEGEVAEVRGAGEDTDDASDATSAAEHGDAEDANDAAQDVEDAAETGGAAEHTDDVEQAELGGDIADPA